MNKIPSKGAEKLLELITKSAQVKKKIDYDSNLAKQELLELEKETLEEKRQREFGAGEISYEAFHSWGRYLKEKSEKFRESAANSKKKG